MPISRPDTIPRVINFIWESNPQSLLDVGVGFGGMGTLFRQTMDVRWGRVAERDWETVLEGIEINDNYRSPAWDIYDYIMIGDARRVIQILDKHYDVVFFGDILEHFTKEDALQLVKDAKRIGSVIIITTPQGFASNEAEAERFGNPNEEHKCLIENSDFPDAIVENFGNQKIMIIKN